MARTVFYRPSGSTSWTSFTGDTPFTITGLAAGSYNFHDGLNQTNFTVAAPPQPGVVSAEDSFTAADGTILAGRTAPTGGVWGYQPGTTAQTGATEPRIANGQVYFPTGATGVPLRLAATVPADCYVQCDFTTFATPVSDGTNNAQPGMILRASDSANTFYLVRQQIRVGAQSGVAHGTWELVRFVNGTPTTVGTFGVTPTQTTRTARISARNNSDSSAVNFVLTVDGTQIGAVLNDTSSGRILTAGGVGLRVSHGGTYTSSATDGVHFDNFSAGALT